MNRKLKNTNKGVKMFAITNILLSYAFYFVYIKSPNGRPTATQILLLALISSLSILLLPNSSGLSFSIGAAALLMNFITYAIICLATTLPVLFGDIGYEVRCSHTFNVEDTELTLVFPWYNCNYAHVNVNPDYVKRHYHLQTKKNKTMTERLMFSYLQEYFYFKSVQSFMSTNK